VTKAGGKSWQVLKPMVLGAVMDHFTAGAPVMETAEAEAEIADAGEDSEIVSQIKELIDTRVRPGVAQDGGDIVYRGFKNGTVYLQMRGSCAGCPSSTATLKHGHREHAAALRARSTPGRSCRRNLPSATCACHRRPAR
jgi:Fe-S cluster biogenesis protein NfuA